MLIRPLCRPMSRPLVHARPNQSLLFSDGVWDEALTFSRASTATYFDASGVIRTAAADVPRLDYDPATLRPRGLLVEGAGTNLLWSSEDFSGARWSKLDSAAVTVNQAEAPNGVLAADLIDLSGSATARISQVVPSGIAKGVAVTASVYLRAVSGAGTYPIAAYDGDNVVGTQLVSLTEEWQRCKIGLTTSTGIWAGGGPGLYVGNRRDVVGGTLTQAYAWGAQIEVASHATSYIPTTAASATRAADVCTLALGDWFNASEGTFVVEASRLNEAVGASDSACVLSLDDGSTANRLQIRVSAPGGGAGGGQFIFSRSGVTQANIATEANPVGTAVARYAAAYRVGSAAFAVNGRLVGTAAPPLVPGPNTTLRLNGIVGISGSEWTGHIRRVLYYPTRLSDAQLQAVTA